MQTIAHLGVFIGLSFIALAVLDGSIRSLWAAHKAPKRRTPRVTAYTGPRYNRHGRPVDNP